MNEGSRRLCLTFEMEQWGWDNAGWHRYVLFILSIVQSIIVSILYHSPFSYSVAFFNERTSNRGCIMDRLRCPSSYTGGGSHQLQAHYYHATPHPDETLVLLKSISFEASFLAKGRVLVLRIFLLPSTPIARVGACSLHCQMITRGWRIHIQFEEVVHWYSWDLTYCKYIVHAFQPTFN